MLLLTIKQIRTANVASHTVYTILTESILGYVSTPSTADCEISNYTRQTSICSSAAIDFRYQSRELSIRYTGWPKNKKPLSRIIMVLI